MDSAYKQGTRERLNLAARGAVLLVCVCLVVAPVLWLTGGLARVEWSGDFVVGVAVAAALYGSVALGFVLSQWRAGLYLWAASAAVVLVQQALWTDDPSRSGIDDLAPAALLPFTPLVMLLPALGVALERAFASRTHSPG